MGKVKWYPDAGRGPLLLVYFDPTLRETFRSGVVAALEKVILGMEASEKMKVLSELLPKEMEAVTRNAMALCGPRSSRKQSPYSY